MSTDRHEGLDYAERWLMDALRVVEAPGLITVVEVDMTRAQVLMERLRLGGVRATYTHVFVRAAALALTRHPELHQLLSGTRRVYPGQVDIGISVSGTTFVAPVMVLVDAGRKSLRELAVEIIDRAPQIREKETHDLAVLRRWGWLVPSARLRRRVLSLLLAQARYRRNLVGTFQVTSLANVDLLIPLLFSTAAALGIGQVRDRVVAIHGQPTVRPIVNLTCCADHKVWDGMRAAIFQNEVKKILEEDELAPEIS